MSPFTPFAGHAVLQWLAMLVVNLEVCLGTKLLCHCRIEKWKMTKRAIRNIEKVLQARKASPFHDKKDLLRRNEPDSGNNLLAEVSSEEAQDSLVKNISVLATAGATVCLMNLFYSFLPGIVRVVALPVVLFASMVLGTDFVAPVLVDKSRGFKHDLVIKIMRALDIGRDDGEAQEEQKDLTRGGSC